MSANKLIVIFVVLPEYLVAFQALHHGGTDQVKGLGLFTLLLFGVLAMFMY